MKLVSWNVNGIRACLGHGLKESVLSLNPDVLFLQETKLSDDSSFPLAIEGMEHVYFTISKVKKGYSGVAFLSKIKPISVHYGLEGGAYDEEGRVITLEFPSFYLVGAYVPNSGEELKRLPFRLEYEKRLVSYLDGLKAKKPVVYTGDMNVAHEESDIKNPASNHHNAGFTDEERNAMSALLSHGYVDTFRFLHPDQVTYSWWSYRFRARERNSGWRIDYYLVSGDFLDRVRDSKIHTEIMGSDHCPIELDLDL